MVNVVTADNAGLPSNVAGVVAGEDVRLPVPLQGPETVVPETAVMEAVKLLVCPLATSAL
jgi:hypothetical protein